MAEAVEMAAPSRLEPFAIKDCALIAIATGRRAYSLKELRSELLGIGNNSVFYHFWGNLLQPRFEEREYNNDFAAWVRHSLHDAPLAERLAVIDPTEFPDLDDLRHEVIDLIEIRLDEREYLRWALAKDSFEFIRSQIVVFDTHRRADSPHQLAALVPHMTASTVFYHFIDARQRTPGGTDDFRHWLAVCGPEYAPLCARLAEIDPYFAPLSELRQLLIRLFAEHFPAASQ
jgi:catechol 2,3-dioxygenase-like lactoylglutathione lyase family enzyme